MYFPVPAANHTDLGAVGLKSHSLALHDLSHTLVPNRKNDGYRAYDRKVAILLYIESRIISSSKGCDWEESEQKKGNSVTEKVILEKSKLQKYVWWVKQI